jgi:L-fuculose-phosphate aldolase
VNYVPGDPRDQLAYVGFDVVRAGLVVGSGGNLSARLPDDPDVFWVTGAGTWLDRLERPSFVRVRTSSGEAIDHRIPATTELALHCATYRMRPDVQAVVHLHPQSVLLLDVLDEPIQLLTTDHVYYLRRVATTPFRPPGTAELAGVAAPAAADGTNCVVLGNHGCSVLGDSIELAHKRARNLEEAARLTYRILALRAAKPRELPASYLDLLEGDQSVAI